MWTLVLIVIINGKVGASQVGTYDNMMDCFRDRESLAITAGGKDGYYPLDMQGICVKRNQIGT